MIQYPEGLPYPERSGYGFQSADPNIETPFVTGRSRTRRRHRSVPTRTPVSWSMSNVQAQLFMSWHEEVLISGNEWFECPLSTPQGDRLYRAKFRGMYTGPLEDGFGYWKFTGVLELFEAPILRGNWALYAPQFMLYMAEIDKAVNSDWPEA